MKRFQTIAATCAGLLVLLLLVKPGLAQEPVVVRVTPATLTLTVGGESDVAVEVVGVEGLYGFDVQMTFDPAVVEVVDADPTKPGVQVSLGRLLDSGMSVRDSADNTTGVIHYAMTQLNPSEAKSGTGNLIVIKLRGKAAGASNLAITSVDLARRDASAIPTSSTGSVVTVAAGAAAQPTNTPIPTQAPPTPVPTALPPATAAPAAVIQPTATSALPTATSAPPTATSSVASTASAPPTATPSAAAVASAPPTNTPQPADTATTVASDTATAAPVAVAVETQAVAGTDPASASQPEPSGQGTAEPTATAPAVASAPADQGSNAAAAPASSTRAAEQQDDPQKALLTIGVVALLAAAVVAVVLVIVLARRRTAS